MNPKILMAIRILLGVFMLVFGLNKFFQFMPMPEMSGDAAEQMRIYASSGFMNVIAILEILIGLALLTNKYVGLALTFSVAIMFNAALFHLFHDPPGIAGALLGLVLSLILVYTNFESKFKDLLSA